MSDGDGIVIGAAPVPDAGDCGCCQGLTAATPAGVSNRPGLSAVAYRAGTHATFKASMLARLSSADHPALAALRTRDDDDAAIALLDGWATVADVLTFYQERLANEAFLRTATERLSVVELARLIGYRLRPGVAASVHLAFAIDAAPGAPAQAVDRTSIAAGTRVQSIPGPGETAQTFETLEAFEARAAWNALRARQRAPFVPGFQAGHVYLAGTATNLRTGDAVLLVGDERAVDDPGSERWDFRRVRRVTVDHDADFTRIDWEPGLGSFSPLSLPAKNPRVYALRLRAALFGHNAPHPNLFHPDVAANFSGQIASSGDWAFTINLTGKTIDLDNAYASIVAGGWLVLAKPTYRELYRAQRVEENARAAYALSGRSTRVVLDTAENLDGFDGADYRSTAVFAQSEELAVAEAPIDTPVWRDSVVLDRPVEGLRPGRLLIVRGPRARVVAAGPLTLASLTQPPTSQSVVAGESLVLLTAPATIAGSGAQRWSVRRANGFEGTVVAAPAAFAFAAAGKDDEIVAELATLKSADGRVDLLTRLDLVAPLAHAYDRARAEIHANVAPATHGESVGEVLGGGDAGHAHQQFVLKQPPLTHVRAATASGARSTLEIRANDVLWREALALYGRGAAERVYVTRLGDDGKTTVEFGDGHEGARLPSGQDNVRATYRKGLGLEGLVKAGQLSLLPARPLGVVGVTNPLPAEGAEDPETLDGARDNAPVTVLTLDRAVSLRDYEDFARGFAGIDKALATWVWDGQTRRVVITVAGPNGAPIPAGGASHTALVQALGAAGDPLVAFRVVSFRPALFRLKLRVKVHPDHAAAIVLPAVEAALRAHFAFASRGFGQPVALSEVIAAAHTVTGVVAIDVDQLFRTTAPSTAPLAHPRLPAAMPQLDATHVLLGAELLSLDPGPLLGLEEMA